MDFRDLAEDIDAPKAAALVAQSAWAAHAKVNLPSPASRLPPTKR
jgi:hypothetical protein